MLTGSGWPENLISDPGGLWRITRGYPVNGRHIWPVDDRAVPPPYIPLESLISPSFVMRAMTTRRGIWPIEADAHRMEIGWRGPVLLGFAAQPDHQTTERIEHGCRGWPDHRHSCQHRPAGYYPSAQHRDQVQLQDHRADRLCGGVRRHPAGLIPGQDRPGRPAGRLLPGRQGLVVHHLADHRLHDRPGAGQVGQPRALRRRPPLAAAGLCPRSGAKPLKLRSSRARSMTRPAATAWKEAVDD